MMLGHCRTAIVVLPLSLGIAFASRIEGATKHVYPGESIQAAIDDPEMYDEIVVNSDPGGTTYNEDLSIPRSLTLRSANGRSLTTIRGTGTTSVIGISGTGIAVRIEGFTITGGIGLQGTQGAYTTGKGGGIRIDRAASVRIVENEIHSNTVSGSFGFTNGGGIYALNCPDLDIVDNSIHDNGADVGAGILIENCPDFFVSANEVFRNGLTRGAYGGGILARSNSTNGTIHSNVVHDNSVTGYGGGFDVWSTGASIINNVVRDNSAQWGGGIYIYRDNETTLHTFLVLHNTVYNNTATSGTPSVNGAGIYLDCASGVESIRNVVTIQNNIAWGNRVGTSPRNLNRDVLREQPKKEYPYDVYVFHNDIESPYDDSFWHESSTGNISADPLFVDSQLHIDPDTPSPCKDAGLAHSHPLAAADFEGDERDASPDIGADEIPGGPALGKPVIASCQHMDGDGVRLIWTNHGNGAEGAYESIEIYRDGDLIESLDGDATEYEDADVFAGVFRYTVKGIEGELSATSDPCEATVPVEAPTMESCEAIALDGETTIHTIRIVWRNDADDPYESIRVHRSPGYETEPLEILTWEPEDPVPTSYDDTTAYHGSFRYWLVAHAAELDSDESERCEETTPIDPPQDPSCTAQELDGIRIAWTSGESDYDAVKIYRSEDPDAPWPWAQIGTQTPDTGSYLDDTARAGAFWYRLVGVIGTEESEPSGACSDTAEIEDPRDLVCTTESEGTLLSWTNMDPYDSIEILRDGDPTPYATLAGPRPEGPDSYTDGDTGGVGHLYAVRGVVDDTPTGSIRCDTSVPPPSGLSGELLAGPRRVALHWTNGAPDYNPIGGVELFRNGDLLIALPGHAEVYDDAAVSAGSYIYKVRGLRGVVPSGFSNEFPIEIPAAAPVDLSCVAVGPDGVALGWTNGEPAYDRIEIRRDGSLIATLPLGTENSYADTFGGGGGGGGYTYTITGILGAQAAISEPCEVVVPVEDPSDLSCAANGGVTLAWTNHDPYDAIEIFRDGGATPIATLPGPHAEGPAGYLDSTVGGGEHSYAVRGVVDGSPTAELTCDVTVPVAPVAGLECLATGPDEVTLAWSNPEDYTGIDILRDGSPLASLPGGSTSYIDPHAGGGSRAYSVIGRIGEEASEPATCDAVVPVDSPGGLSCVVNPDDSVDLSWTNEDPYDSIEILKDGDLVGTLPGTATSHSLALDGNGTHTLGVRGRIGAVAGDPATCEVRLGIEPPSDLACGYDPEDGWALIVWVNNDPYDSIDIVRDGATIASLGPGVGSYADSDADPGPHTYEVVGHIGEESAASEPCATSVPLPPVSGLTCEADGFEVRLSWTNGYAYEEVRIFRNGALVAVLPGAPSSASDTVPSEGNYRYRVRGVYRGVLSDGPDDECAVSIEEIPPVRDLACEADGWNIRLTWQNPIAYDEIRILRGGTPIATLQGDATSYEEEVGAPGDYLYGVVGRRGGRGEPVECLVRVTLVPAPTDLACTVFDVVDVHLAWTNAMPYDSIIVSRNGLDIATLPGTAISHDDLALGVGSFLYGVRGIVSGLPPSAEATCSVAIEPPAAVEGLSCAASPASFDVALAWRNAGPYTQIVVRRDGAIVATLPGTATGHTDTVPAPGPYAYEVIPFNGPLSAPPATCAPTVTYVPSVADLRCDVAYRKIAMSWTNAFAYTGISIRRNGVPIAALPGTATAYTEVAPSGSYLYEAIGLVDPYASEPRGCEATLAGFPPPQDLACAARERENILSWSNPVPYTAIRILRDGSPIATLGGEVTMFVDWPGRGTFLYELVGIIDDQASETAASCSLTNGYVEPPADLACAADPHAKTVSLAWTNGEAYANIEIRRNGALIATLGGAATSYLDTVPGQGTYAYAVTGIIGTYRSAEATCAVRIGVSFVRSDANADGSVDIGDPMFILDYIFQDGLPPLCLDSADANLDRRIDIADSIWILAYLFQHGLAPFAPFPACGQAPEGETLGCKSFPPCEAP